MGGLCFWLAKKGYEPGAGVNEAPVEPQSGPLSEPAGEGSNPISRTKQIATHYGWLFARHRKGI